MWISSLNYSNKNLKQWIFFYLQLNVYTIHTYKRLQIYKLFIYFFFFIFLIIKNKIKYFYTRLIKLKCRFYVK